jgi:signal transduction histidine kinase
MAVDALTQYTMSLDRFFQRQDARVVTVEALVGLAVVGYVDWVTGWELSVSSLYALIVLLVAWRVDRNTALIFALASGAIWFTANYSVNPYSSKWSYVWATCTRLGYFLFVAIGGASLRAHQETTRAHIQALERARDLEHQLARVSEREQRRIGQDLHDGVCQSLAAVHYALTSLREDLQTQSPKDAESVKEIAGMVKQTIAEARGLAKGIFPVQMEEVGLAAVLDELVAATKRVHRVDATFEMQGNVTVSDPDVAMHLYRIAQEALSNALKHGKASRITVGLQEDEGRLCLSVADNGAGFPASPSDEQGMGLKTMRHRANVIGADLSMDPNPTGGVRITCSLPLNGSHPPASNSPES